MKELLENAVLSIELGVEDYQTGDERRVLSAIRNLYAGVLLLCKQVLWNESPPGTDGSLIYKDLVPRRINGTVQMVPRKPHRNTVDRQQIEERFKELSLNLDWSKLQELARIRNDVEHLFMTVKPAIAKEALASGMPVIEQLLVEHLQEDPAHLFRDGVWKALLENKDVFDQQQARCIESFQNVNWGFDTLVEAASEIRCSICTSSLVRQIDPDNQNFDEMEMDCAECGAVLDREEVFEAAIGEATAGDAYIAMTDGGESVAKNSSFKRSSLRGSDHRPHKPASRRETSQDFALLAQFQAKELPNPPLSPARPPARRTGGDVAEWSKALPC